MTLQNSISETDQLSPTVFVFLSVSSSSAESLWAAWTQRFVRHFRFPTTQKWLFHSAKLLLSAQSVQTQEDAAAMSQQWRQHRQKDEEDVERKFKDTVLEIDKVEPFLLFEMFGNVTAPQQAWHMYCGNFVLGGWYSERQFHVFMERFHKEKDQIANVPSTLRLSCCGCCCLPEIHRKAWRQLRSNVFSVILRCFDVSKTISLKSHHKKKLQTIQVLVLHGLRRRGLCFSSTKDEALKPSGGNKQHKVSCRSKF